ncbi:MAG: ABC transporter permease [Nocardioidaceae bacterium]
MSGTFTPNPAAAPLHKQVRAHAAMEARLMLRNGEQLLLAMVIPILVLVGAVLGADRLDLNLSARAVDVFTPGVLALAVMSTSFASLAIATGFERRYGVIKRLGSSPLPRHGLLLGKIQALLMIQVLQLLVICVVAFALGWEPHVGFLPFFSALLLGTAAFASLGLFVAGVMRAEATLAAANLLYLLMMAGGAVVLPASAYGGFGRIASYLPSGALGEAMREALQHGSWSLPGLGVMAAWAVLGIFLTARTFKWE